MRSAILLALTLTTAAHAAAPCKQSLAQCPPEGCAAPGTPEAAANRVRRTLPLDLPARLTLSLDDLEVLQLATDRVFRQGFGIAPRDRPRLRTIGTKNGLRYGERDVVQVRGYIVGTPHRRRADSANCNLVGLANNNVRLHLAAEPTDTEYDSIIAEITPVQRPSSWTLAKLRKLQREERLVLITGQLFYDSKHTVNNDPDAGVRSDPPRLALWELHPVTAIAVCTRVTNNCRVDEPHAWEPLATYD